MRDLLSWESRRGSLYYRMSRETYHDYYLDKKCNLEYYHLLCKLTDFEL